MRDSADERMLAMPSNRSADDTDRAVGLRIRNRRISRGVTQSALAEAAGITFQQIQKYENGKNRISVGRLAAIARTLQISLADLIPESEGAITLTEAFDADTLRLARAFTRIPDPAIRRAIRNLVEAAVGYGGEDR